MTEPYMGILALRERSFPKLDGRARVSEKANGWSNIRVLSY